YGQSSNRIVNQMLAVKPAVGIGQRVGSLQLSLRGRFRGNPMLHADCLLGVGTGNVVWSNYEAAHYYFPVHFRRNLPHPPELEFEQISVLDDPRDAVERRIRWRRLLDHHHAEIDRLVINGSNPELESVSQQWFESGAVVGDTQIWRRRP